MAKNITGQVLGGQPKAGLEAATVGDVFEQLALSGSYTATVNGDAADLDDELDDYMFVSFAPAVKGGC